jgi:hypothetical protein
MEKASGAVSMRVARLQMPGGKGIRPIRPSDAVLDGKGRCVGWVLSCAGAGEDQFALAYGETADIAEGDPVGIYYLARNPGQIKQGKRQAVAKGETLQPDLSGRKVARFAKF